ncbi:MAG: hypothetical protein ACRD3W_03215, partial [Terriglobales bacterium]
SEHVELGSAIRSACAFGWNRVFLEDRCDAWFGGDHAAKREARAAARRSKNEIRVIPTKPNFKYQFERATIVTTTQDKGTPLHTAKLADGPQQLIVVADESTHSSLNESVERFAGKVDYAHIEVPAAAFKYHFRLLSSIVMAEIARQVGQKTPWRPTPQEPLYESALRTVAEQQGEIVALEDLQDY